MISIKDLTVKYGKSIAVHNVNMEIKDGSRAFIIGPNGSGKSTFLKAMIGLVSYSGNMSYDNTLLTPSAKISVNTNIKEALYISSYLKVSEMLRFHAKIRNEPFEKAYAMLNELKLSDIMEKRIGKLSTGQEKMVYNIIALLGNPKLITMDEPFENIDPWRVEILSDLINRKSNTLMIASHMVEIKAILDTFHDANTYIFFKGHMFGPIGPMSNISNLYVKFGEDEKGVMKFKTEEWTLTILDRKESGSIPLSKIGDLS